MSGYYWISDGRKARLASRRRSNARVAAAMLTGALALAIQLLWPMFASKPRCSYSEAAPGIAVTCEKRVQAREDQVRVSWDRDGAPSGSCFAESEDFPDDIEFWWEPGTARLRLVAFDQRGGQTATALLDFTAGRALFDGRAPIEVRATSIPRASDMLPAKAGEVLGRWMVLRDAWAGTARTGPVAYAHWSPKLGTTALRERLTHKGHAADVVIESSASIFREGEIRSYARGRFAFYAPAAHGGGVCATLDQKVGEFIDENRRVCFYDPASGHPVRQAKERAPSYPRWAVRSEGMVVARQGSGGG